MARTDFSLLSTAPPEEPCAEGYRALEEGRRYIKLLRETVGPEPEGAQLKVRGNPHDFGTYHTVDLLFDDEDEAHVAYMRRLENDGPAYWPDVP